MPNKGFKSLVENTPDFSNQTIENAINELKIGWVTKSTTLDTAIQDNTVLTASQKNDLKDTINNIAHLNIGRYLNDAIRHTSSILDATIVPIPAGEPQTATFLELLQYVHSMQNLIPSLYGVTPAEKSRSVNDHLGTLNNMFSETEDSSKPVFINLKENITFINNASLATETLLGTAYDNLKNFVNSVVADSTDFQQTLNTYATAVATAHTNFNNALASEPYLTKRTQLTTDRDTIVTQQNLENSNLSDIRTYMETLSNNFSYSSLAENTELREFITKVSQNVSWKTYFNDYEKNQSYINPLYNTVEDSDKETVITNLMEQRGLYNVTDSIDLNAVANKAVNGNDYGIDSKGFDLYTIETVIKKCCEQLNINTVNNTVYQQSELLLNHLNQRDKEIIAEAIDRNEDANTLS
jgi:hypothetical protein